MTTILAKRLSIVHDFRQEILISGNDNYAKACLEGSRMSQIFSTFHFVIYKRITKYDPNNIHQLRNLKTLLVD